MGKIILIKIINIISYSDLISKLVRLSSSTPSLHYTSINSNSNFNQQYLSLSLSSHLPSNHQLPYSHLAPLFSPLYFFLQS